MSEKRNKNIDPVDAVPSAPKLGILGLQHVLAFYAGAVIVPLVIADGLGLSTADTIRLINADLLTCGIASIIQAVGVGSKIGVRLPLVQGVTFTAVPPIIAIGMVAGGGTLGLATVYGAIIVAGVFTFLVAPYFAKLLRFFPPVVTGSLLTIMGTTLLSVAAADVARWGTQDGSLMPRALAYGMGTLVLIVLVQRFAKGFLATISVLLGLVIGTGVAWAFGDTDFSGVGDAAVFGFTTPFFYGTPVFSLSAIIAMILVMMVTMVETTGDVFATGEIVGRRITPKHIAAALRADGVSTIMGGVLNSFPYTCFAQNVGLVRLTRVKSRWVIAAAGAIMIVLGLLPKAGAIVAAIPAPVLGGASIAMFANVAVVGIQTLTKVDLRDNRNAVIVSTSIGVAMLVTFQPSVVTALPSWAQVLVGSGVTIGSIVAIVLNILFFHTSRNRGSDIATHGNQPVSLAEVNQMSHDEFVATFAVLYPSQWPVEQAWNLRPFKDVTALRNAFVSVVLGASETDKRALFTSYHDIADLLVDPEQADADVKALQETSLVALGKFDDRDREQMRAISAAYQERHAIPWIVSTKRLESKEDIFAEGWLRVESVTEVELLRAASEVVFIANLRFDALIADANPTRAAWAAKFTAVNA